MEVISSWSAAAPALVGVILGAVLTALFQYLNTRQVLTAEREKLALQFQGDQQSRRQDRKRERLLDTISELLERSDPEADERLDYPLIARLILRAQLLLDLAVPAEKEVNGALNQLGIASETYVASPANEEVERRVALLRLRGQLLNLAKPVVQ
jgi:hypothetical protein